MNKIDLSITRSFAAGALFFMAFLILNACQPTENHPNISAKELEQGFLHTPDSMQTSVYWYWVSDNLSKEGVIKDLESMKAVGINRAFIGNIGLGAGDQPYGSVKLFTDEWWDILHAALKKATELDIEIGIFNSPGWSQSGGPWIQPEQAMRYLAASETRVTGAQHISCTLEQPAAIFQDYKVLACLLPETQSLTNENAIIRSAPQLPSLNNLLDQRLETEINLGNLTDLTLLIDANDEIPVRSITVSPAHSPIDVDVEIQVKEGDVFHTSSRFNVNRTNANNNVGFKPYGEVVISIPETVAKHFKVLITNRTPHAGIKELSFSSAMRQERYIEKSLAKMFQSPLPYWHDYLWDTQADSHKSEGTLSQNTIIDITDYMDESGLLSWEAPEGDWLILRTGLTPTGVTNAPASPEGVGLEVDKMSTEHVLYHFESFLGEIIKRIPAADRQTWKVVVQDSYETGGQNWTDKLRESFIKRYGYDPDHFLPAMNGFVVDSRDVTDRFLWDLRRLIADKVSYDYVGGLREVSHRYGLTTWLENYGHWGFPGEFLQYGGQSDEIGGEFWSEGELGDIENRAAASCAHIYGKTKVSAESFTCAGAPFSRHPWKMKQRGDRFFAEGINNTLLHVYVHQAYEDKEPGMNAWFGNEFNRNNTWFYEMDVFIEYLKRCNYMLQQGVYAADVAYFIGEDTPKMTGVRDPEIPKGYSYDYINAEVIQKYLTVKDGKWTLPNGIQYRVLVLPKLDTMRPELLKQIQKLTEQGGVLLGTPPRYSPSFQNYPVADQEVQEIANSLWADVDGINKKHRKAGKGMVASGLSMEELFALLAIKPDLTVSDNGLSIEFIHRKLQNGEVYFLTNQQEKDIQGTVSFRVDGLKPELWDPVTATIRSLPEYTPANGLTHIDLKLHPLQSVFIVFRSGGEVKKSLSGCNYPIKENTQTLDAPWTVAFDKQKRGPSQPITMNTLKDWTSFDNDSIKFYAGKATYQTAFTYEPNSKKHQVYLNLSPFNSMAEVRINGQSAGKIWTAPWEIEISSLLKEGENKLEIIVVNNWQNRLIGDAQLPMSQRGTWAPVNPYQGTEPLQSSGLIGPVQLYSIQY